MATNSPGFTQLDTVIAGAVRAEIARAQMRHVDVAQAIGLAPQLFNRKARGESRFTAGELVAVAVVLGIPLERLTADAASVVAA